MINSLLRDVVSGAVFATLLSGVGQAQGTHSALLTGEIVDPFKAPLAQVEVRVKDTTDRVVATTRTDSNGMFLVRGLAHHTQYLVSTYRIGYAPDSVRVVTPKVRDTLWFDVQLLAVIPKLDTVETHSALLTGEVLNPFKAPLGHAEIFVKDTANRIVATTRTDSGGMFLVRGLAHHTQYSVLIRRIGYAPDTGTVVTPRVQDTVWFNVKLLAVTPQLDTVNVAAKANHSSGFFGGIRTAYKSLLNHSLACGAESAATATTPGFHWDWSLNDGTSDIVRTLVGSLCQSNASPQPPPSTTAPATPSTTH